MLPLVRRILKVGLALAHDRMADVPGTADRDSVSKAEAAPAASPQAAAEICAWRTRDAAAFDNRGALRWARGDLDLAIDDCSEVIRREPNSSDAYYARGRMRSARGNFAGALSDFSEAIRLDPRYADAFAARAVVVWRLAMPTEL